MKKYIILVILSILLTSAFACNKTSFNNTDGLKIITSSDIYVAITISDEHMELTNKTTLLDYMNVLKEKEMITFETSGTMLVSLNNTNNSPNYSLYWMLYTDDDEYSNPMWGTVIYNGITCNSVSEGLSTLKIKEGHLYLWVYSELDGAL